MLVLVLISLGTRVGALGYGVRAFGIQGFRDSGIHLRFARKTAVEKTSSSLFVVAAAAVVVVVVESKTLASLGCLYHGISCSLHLSPPPLFSTFPFFSSLPYLSFFLSTLCSQSVNSLLIIATTARQQRKGVRVDQIVPRARLAA
ncbi:hypothetical protein JOL62DRAFT_573016 [Phyllosticta paracitricarpa]|uniref:Uncharacterized protein n=1 Tax=Phyllosticta paracitricarpa TaxID=2016321 RepID=A0ABR1N900_9PEZI